MGAGDVFRAVAQGLMGAGNGAINYALDRDAEERKQRNLLAYLQASKEHKELLPIEEEKIRAEINALNRRNAGGGGGGGGDGGGSAGKLDSQIETLIKQEEAARGQPFDPSARATIKRRFLEGHLIKLSGNSLDARPDLQDPFQNLPTRAWSNPLLKLDNAPSSAPSAPTPSTIQAPTPAASPVPSPASLPPRKPNETQDQYSARTGIKFK